MGDVTSFYQNRCPSCEAAITASAKKCKCGWKSNAFEKENKIIRYCNVPGCGVTKNLVRIGRDEPAVFWCQADYEVRRKKSDIELEVDRRTKMFADAAKAEGVSNYEFCRNYLGKNMLGRKILKELEKSK